MFLILSLFFFIILGFLNAAFLYWQFLRYEKTGRKIFCPISGKCEQVIESIYGRTFGIKNEVIGLGYYSILFILLIIFWFYIPLLQIFLLVLVISLIAAAFSVYLLYVQTFILRNFCSWCVAASIINFIIFILAGIYLIISK